MRRLLLIGFMFFLSLPSLGFYTEIGVSYSRKKTSFDQNNFFDSESLTGSLSFYFAERIALELSYTDGNSVREEQVAGSKYVTFQKTKVLGSDLILIFADRKAFVQPYIKGGMAQLTRQQIITINSTNEDRLDPDVAIVPSYGAGLKFSITDSLGLKFSYDAWKTPIGGNQTTVDSQIRAGFTWIF